MTTSQKAMVPTRAAEIYEAEARKRMATSTGGAKPQPKRNLPVAATGQSRDQAGKALGVSGNSVDFAKRVSVHGTPKRIRAAEEDRVAMSTAAAGSLK